VDLDNVPEKCYADAKEWDGVKKWLPESMKLLVLSAWGDRGPASYYQKNRWFDSSEVVLFCNLKKAAIRFWGRENYDDWAENLMNSAPGADKLSPTDRNQRSLLSTRCEVYR
jgi:hypothetical protein